MNSAPSAIEESLLAGDGDHCRCPSPPQEDDQVVPIQDGQVFLEASAADALHDKTLDAQIDDEGGASFSVVDQATS
jgi:hypothetical protein